MIIRSAKIKDIEKTSELNIQMIRHHDTFGEVFKSTKNSYSVVLKWHKRSIYSKKRKLLVAECDGKIIGYLHAYIRKRPIVFESVDWGFISDLYVKGEYRKQGIGQKLVAESMKWFKEKKLKYADLHVATGNKDAQKFWESLGFDEYFKQMCKKI